MMTLQVLVCTIVHHPQDARILHRQIRALLDAGHHVTYAAPFTAYETEAFAEVDTVDLPRAVGRERTKAIRAARKLFRDRGEEFDVILLHDPELLLATIGQRLDNAIVWDVHEDTGAALVAKPWLPGAVRPFAGATVRALEDFAERRYRLMLAESGYRSRFRGVHPVVLNTTYVPDTVVPPGVDRIVYVGHLTAARGVDAMVGAARLLAGSGLTVDVIGQADAYSKPLLREAMDDNVLTWHGFVPNNKAMALLDGALCGISLLRDLPNYRHSMPTKVLEYMAHGVPVVTTPLPSAVTLAQVHKCGIVVPFDDPAAAADAVLRLRDDRELRIGMGHRGHQAARMSYHWPDTAREFVYRLERWAKAARPHPCLALGTD